MLVYMLDTDISIYLIKNRPPHLRERFDSLAGQMCISTITLGELWFGAEKSVRQAQNIEAIEGFAARLEILPFSAGAAAHFGQIRAHLARLGRIAGPFDMLIGGHARSENLILVTNNLREFERIPGLQVEIWVPQP
jgi:tRNA(fMet)-specific endonuclease VapC